jgi:hypothetical protein
MHSKVIITTLAACALGACASARLSPAEVSAREQTVNSAELAGAAGQAQSSQYLSLSDRELAQAQVLAKRNDRIEGHNLLAKSRADAELALALAQQRAAHQALQKAGMP